MKKAIMGIICALLLLSGCSAQSAEDRKAADQAYIKAITEHYSHVGPIVTEITDDFKSPDMSNDLWRERVSKNVELLAEYCKNSKLIKPPGSDGLAEANGHYMKAMDDYLAYTKDIDDMITVLAEAPSIGSDTIAKAKVYSDKGSSDLQSGDDELASFTKSLQSMNQQMKSQLGLN